MFGKSRRGRTPASLWVNEGALVDGLHEFLAEHVFGDNRRVLLASTMSELDQESAQRITATEKAIRDV